jgi:hypothetical protein
LSNTRNHHFVPRAYLRGFAQGAPAYPQKFQTFVTDLLRQKSFTTEVRNVAAVRDFNRVEFEHNEHDPNVLEEIYGTLESSAASAIRRIARTGQFGGEDKIIVLNLIGLMATRNPRLRRNWSDFQTRIYKSIAGITVSSRERFESIARRAEAARPVEARREIKPEDYEKVKAFVSSGEYDVVTHQNTHIKLEVNTFETVLRTLVDRKWILQIATKSAGDFVTCDHPVILRNTQETAGFLGRSAGHAMMNTMLLFPLTRRLSLFGSFEGEDGVIPVGPSLVGRMNSMIIDNADAQVYAVDDSFQYWKGGGLHAGKELYRDLDARRRVHDEDD